MKVTVTVKYNEPYLPTPRCRKYRNRTASKDTALTIREVTGEEAPVAFIVHKYDGDQEIRFFNGKCYKASKWSDYHCGASGLLPPEKLVDYFRGRYDYWNCNYKENRKAFAEEAKRFLVIDGVLWEQTGEPRYCIYTFGLGHNHGGTSLSVDFYYNGNISKDRYFSALESARAVATANRIASGRGDTESVGKFHKMIDVLIPEAVKVKPSKQHGNGDPFMNSLENMIEKTDSSFEAGLLAIMMATSDME